MRRCLCKIAAIIRIFVVVIACSNQGWAVDSRIDAECLTWFQRAKIKPGTRCEMECSSIPVDMGTYTCGENCKELCSLASESSKIPEPGVYTPWLNVQELKLVALKPGDALKVNELRRRADTLTEDTMGRNLWDDESDAFRHFVWASLLRRDIGVKSAKEFLDAHEASEMGSTPARAMDLANNRAGLLAEEEMETTGKVSEDRIVLRRLDELKNGNLIVLRKLGMPK